MSNQEYYGLSNTTLTQSEIKNITADIGVINSDWNNPNISINTKMNEMAKYYTDQGFSRSYATQASYVVLNQDDPNGNVANSNIGDYYESIGQEFTEKTRLNVSYNLINKDYQLLTQQNYIIPNENEITDEHVQIFNNLGIPITYWGGAIFAQNNVNFVSGIYNPAETINSQFMANYMPNSNNNVEDLNNLIIASIFDYENFTKYRTLNKISELFDDSINLLKSLSIYGLESGINSLTSTEDLGDSELNIKDENNNNILSLNSKNNIITYNVGDTTNNTIKTIQHIQNGNDITFGYDNNELSSITSINSAGIKSITSIVGNNIFVNGKKISDNEVADAFNKNTILNKINSLINLSQKQFDPIIISLTKQFNIKQLSTLDNYQSFDKSNTQYLTQSLGKNTYYLVSIGNNDKPIFYNQSTLSSLNTNKDGIINSSDEIYSQLYIWNPSDGPFTQGNVKKISDIGITEINLTPSLINNNYNGSTEIEEYSTNNKTINMGDFNLQYSPIYTITQADQEISNYLQKTQVKFDIVYIYKLCYFFY